MFDDLLVLGAGSAGLLAALAVRRHIPLAKVRVLRSPEIGVIGVGESTTPNLPTFLFEYLGIRRRRFFELAEPTWKLGIHFLWGPRDCFEYTFTRQMDFRLPELPRPMGYYSDDDFTAVTPCGALMTEKKAFYRHPNNPGPQMIDEFAFHLENAKFVKTLERLAMEAGIEFIDGKVSGAERGPAGISAVVLEDGRRLAADFFIDASGFRSELLGKALAEPYVSFTDSLFNDSSLLASWPRTDEPILPYTTAETMDAGWSWQIEHEQVINRGYVYSSHHISEEEARAEFAGKNPKAHLNDRVVRFRSGRYARGWAENVMAVGNACGFVEPLEATAIMMICWQCQTFVELTKFVGPTPSIRDLYNRMWSLGWDEIRDFLTLHYTLNTRLDTPYWQSCRNEADASRLAELMPFYEENGPTGFLRYVLKNPASQFGVEGFLVMLVGNKAPYRNRHVPAQAEWNRLNAWRSQNRLKARSAVSVQECLAWIRHPQWEWSDDSRPPAEKAQ